jgi:hypothetical protein
MGGEPVCYHWKGKIAVKVLPDLVVCIPKKEEGDPRANYQQKNETTPRFQVEKVMTPIMGEVAI